MLETSLLFSAGRTGVLLFNFFLARTSSHSNLASFAHASFMV